MLERHSAFGVIAILATLVLLFAAFGSEHPAVANSEGTNLGADDSPLLIRSKGKYGLIDRAGNLILQPKYDSLLGFDSSYRRRSNEIRDSGDHESLRPAKINHKWGYIDNEGKEVIVPQFSMAGPFRDGWAQVKVGEEWGVIDTSGKFVIHPKYSFIGPFRSGIARVAIGGIRIEMGFPLSKWGYINAVGEEIVPPQYDYALSFVNGRALVNTGGKWHCAEDLPFQGGRWAVIDESGNIVVEPKLEIGSGTALHESEVESYDVPQPVKYDGKFGFRDSNWNFVVEPTFDEAQPFREMLACVKKDGRYGYINKSGQWIINPRFAKAADFSEGLAPVTTTDGICYIDERGKEILKLNCDEALPFDGGLAAIRVGKLWGLVDKRGRFIQQPRFTSLHQTDDVTYAQVGDELRGLLDANGKVIVEPKYGYLGGFQENGFAMIDTESMGLPPEFWLIDRQGRLVPGPMLPFRAENRHRTIAFFPKQIESLWGIADAKGKQIIEPRFTAVEMLAVGILGVRQGNKLGMFDLEHGKLIIEPTYYSISRFSEGLAEVRPDPPIFPPGNGEWVGYIDLKGQLVIPKKFARGGPFQEGIANVNILYEGDFDSYYIDQNGKYLWHPNEHQ